VFKAKTTAEPTSQITQLISTPGVSYAVSLYLKDKIMLIVSMNSGKTTDSCSASMALLLSYPVRLTRCKRTSRST
jgi:hypothetical protein